MRVRNAPAEPMNSVRQSFPKSHSELAVEWDRVAAERDRQLGSGQDLSFEHILVPAALELLQSADRTVVLEIGSGTGHFTRRLADVAQRVVGVEPSPVSVNLAESNCRDRANVCFIEASIEEAAGRLRNECVTAAVANMSLMTAPDLPAVAAALTGVLPVGAKLVATLCHPCYWPRYWGYESEPWFEYHRELFVEAPFKISCCGTDMCTTHIHRPLSRYVRVFGEVGLMLDAVTEPMPGPDIEDLYPERWLYPRFIGLRWVRAA